MRIIINFITSLFINLTNFIELTVIIINYYYYVVVDNVFLKFKSINIILILKKSVENLYFAGFRLAACIYASFYRPFPR